MLEAESEGAKEVPLPIADRGTGVSYGDPVVETLGNLMPVWSTGCVAEMVLFKQE